MSRSIIKNEDGENVKKVIERNSGILLDIGAGENKQPGFVGLDKRKLPGIDIIHDLEVFPYPLEDESCLTIIGSHIAEHIAPWLTIHFFDELWRILKVNGQLALSMPYAGSAPYWQDPTHVNGYIESTFQYFDPLYPLYLIYQPKPWRIEKGFPCWQTTGVLEIMMRKMSIDELEGLEEKKDDKKS